MLSRLDGIEFHRGGAKVMMYTNLLCERGVVIGEKISRISNVAGVVFTIPLIR